MRISPFFRKTDTRKRVSGRPPSSIAGDSSIRMRLGKPLWRLILLIGVLSTSIPFINAETLSLRNAEASSQQTLPVFFAQTTDLSDTLRQARGDGKAGIVVLYEINGCGECKKLRATAFQNQPLQEFFTRSFVTVSIMADEPVTLIDFDGKKTTQLAFAGTQEVFALPTVIFYDLDALPLVRHIGSASPPEEWLLLGQYVHSAGYEALPFPAWRSAQQNNAADAGKR